MQTVGTVMELIDRGICMEDALFSQGVSNRLLKRMIRYGMIYKENRDGFNYYYRKEDK